MIYCVVPEALEAELYEKLCEYYEDDDKVSVIVDRRREERRERRPSGEPDNGQAPRRELRDRRRPRVTGEFPPLDKG